MAAVPSKRVTFSQKGRSKCSPSCPHLIYDEPHVFRVHSERPSSHSFACEACLRKAQRQQVSSANHHLQQRCSRLPPAPIDSEYSYRPHTYPSNRTANDINWENFMKNKSRYAIPTPYAHCNLTDYQSDPEDRPPFVNYGARYNDKRSGEKRTFNSLAVHQLKHQEVNEQRLRSSLREERLRQEAEKYFREMDRRRLDDQHRHSSNEYRSTQE